MRALVLPLAFAALGFLPGAAAECVETTCADVVGTRMGSCASTGFESNTVFVSSFGTPAGETGAGAFQSCASYPQLEHRGSTASAYVYATGPTGRMDVGVYWARFDNGGAVTCVTALYGTPFGIVDLGCPAGGPPMVPRLLP